MAQAGLLALPQRNLAVESGSGGGAAAAGPLGLLRGLNLQAGS